MGLTYRTYLDGTRIFGCTKCRTHLSTSDNIISKVGFHKKRKKIERERERERKGRERERNRQAEQDRRTTTESRWLNGTSTLFYTNSSSHV